MKHYDFDQLIERQHTDCVKHDALPAMYGRDDLLPMWVADMDFRSPDFVIDAMRRRLDHPVLGYGMPPDGYWKAVTEWLAQRYGIVADRSELHFIPGIVAGIAYALLCLTQPGDKILVTTPVYPPFLNLPHDSGRTLVGSPLKISDGRFEIDFDDFERRAEGCKMLILSNPHNPAGTVWGAEVLRRVADICERHRLIVISDEIHADLTLPGHNHVSYSTVSEAARHHSITFMAPSKTFNIAGLGSSVCHIGDEGLRSRFFGWLDAMGVAGGNIFAFTAAEAAFAHGGEWLGQMLDYLQGNVDTLRTFLRERLPRVKAVLPEASYLAWLDFGDYGLSHKELCDRFINRARVVMNDGTTFGLPTHAAPADGAVQPYACCFRLNIGCPRTTLLDALQRIAAAL
jgi:cystathionine beta-lyase